MAKNQTQTDIDNAISSFGSRFLELQGVFLRKGFFGKINVIILMTLATLSLVFTLAYLLIAWLYALIFAAMGLEVTRKMSKVIKNGDGKAYKVVTNGEFVQDGIDNITKSVLSSIGLKLDVAVHDGLPFIDRGVLRKYFKLLKIKDKAALLLINGSSCQELLKQYDKAHKSPRRLEQTLSAEKIARKANKKAVKKTLSIVNSVSSWSTVGSPIVTPVI